MNVLYKETALLNYEVVRLVLDDRRAWQLLIAENNDAKDKKIKVKLGRFDTDKRMQRFIRILPALVTDHGLANGVLTENNIKLIDMRYPNGFAVQKAANKVAAGDEVSEYAIDDAANNNYKTLNVSHDFASEHKHAMKKMSEA